ncbi:MAG: dihydrolipoyl dehydrogenase [Nitrosomonas sp.]|nr:dihydrolipoyl dehydrogenase [Nitrosomonas sp.]
MFDVIIIGAGSAGLSALREVRKRTDNFLIINAGHWGTTCARVGCMPSKLLIEAANAYHRRFSLDEFGITGAQQLRVDSARVLERVRRLRDEFVAGVRQTTEKLGNKAVSGRAKLSGPNEIMLDDQLLRARSIILATGSRPVMPDPWRQYGSRVLTTDDLFELETLPKRMAVIGMGAVGLEMAQALARLGVEVTGFGSSEFLGGLTDSEVNDVARASILDEFQLCLGARADLVGAAPDGGIVVKADEEAVEVDYVLAALGRRANLDGLGLECLGLPLDDKGLPPLDPVLLQVADLPIFIAGDVNGSRPLLHEASDDGHIAGLNATAIQKVRFCRRTPLSIVFSSPQIALVGRTYHELQQAGVDMAIGQVSFENQGRARSAQMNRGVLRVYGSNPGGVLLGAELCAPAGEHLSHLLALAIERNLTVWDFLRMPFYHPVLEEGLRTALRDLASQLPACPESDLAACEPLGCDALD